MGTERVRETGGFHTFGTRRTRGLRNQSEVMRRRGGEKIFPLRAQWGKRRGGQARGETDL